MNKLKLFDGLRTSLPDFKENFRLLKEHADNLSASLNFEMNDLIDLSEDIVDVSQRSEGHANYLFIYVFGPANSGTMVPCYINFAMHYDPDQPGSVNWNFFGDCWTYFDFDATNQGWWHLSLETYCPHGGSGIIRMNQNDAILGIGTFNNTNFTPFIHESYGDPPIYPQIFVDLDQLTNEVEKLVMSVPYSDFNLYASKLPTSLKTLNLKGRNIFLEDIDSDINQCVTFILDDILADLIMGDHFLLESVKHLSITGDEIAGDLEPHFTTELNHIEIVDVPLLRVALTDSNFEDSAKFVKLIGNSITYSGDAPNAKTLILDSSHIDISGFSSWIESEIDTIKLIKFMQNDYDASFLLSLLSQIATQLSSYSDDIIVIKQYNLSVSFADILAATPDVNGTNAQQIKYWLIELLPFSSTIQINDQAFNSSNLL